MTMIGLAPAYGRDYKSKADILNDWNRDRDFIMTDFDAGGRYVNRRDLRLSGFVGSLKFRYKCLTKVAVFDLDYSR